jgi:hypothetical protein
MGSRSRGHGPRPADKIALVEGLPDAGLRRIQVTSFVGPRAVSKLAATAEVLRGIRKPAEAALSAPVPNPRGAGTSVDLDRLIDTALGLQGVHMQDLPGQVVKAGPRLRLHDAMTVATASG